MGLRLAHHSVFGDRIELRPAIAFSLAQAERRQYFVSRERARLERAIELFGKYLQEVQSGGRRADATDALGQLEPLAIASAKAPEGELHQSAAPDKTRVMISCAAPSASISLDGAAAASAPLIAQVVAGTHRVRVSAPGFFASERKIDAVAGEFVPLEVALREQPAVVLVRASPAADLHVDGSFVGNVGHEKRLELASGAHRFSFERVGYRLQSVEARLAPGTTRSMAAKLSQTGQRTAAFALFIAGGASLGAGVVFSALAVDRENAAKQFLGQRATGNVSATELGDYARAKDQRDRFRIVGATAFVGAAGTLVTGLFLYALDQPDVTESPAPRTSASAPKIRVSLLTSGKAPTLAFDAKMQF